MLYSIESSRFHVKSRTFASSKEKEAKRGLGRNTDTFRITCLTLNGKMIMTQVTTSIAFAIVAIAAIVSNASVFSSRLD